MAAATGPSVFNHEATPGACLLAAACASMALANSPLAGAYDAVLHTDLGWKVGDFGRVMPVSHWIKDLLMAVFFFFVGLELKREFVDGQLRSVRRAALPLAGALGGMIAPPLIYLALNAGNAQTAAGWGVPMAKDIACALGVLSLLGRRVPPALKVFLLALAIVDDLGAILSIALFYRHGMNAGPLLAAFALFGRAVAMNRLGVKAIWLYLLLGVPLWWAITNLASTPPWPA